MKIGVPESTVVYLSEHAGDFPGVRATREYVRLYPQHNLATQVLGYVNGITADEYAKYLAESIKKFRILPAPFSIESGELTPTLKLKRKVVNQRYAEVIDGMFRD